MDDIYDKLIDLQICPRDMWWDMRDEVRSMLQEVYSASDPVVASHFYAPTPAYSRSGPFCLSYSLKDTHNAREVDNKDPTLPYHMPIQFRQKNIRVISSANCY